MEWTKDKIIAMINMYRERTLLWNQFDDFFRYKGKREAAWKEIAMAMGTTVCEAQRKMHSLLASYRRERKKYEDGANPGPAWFAYKHLVFLRQSKTQLSDLKGKVSQTFVAPHFIEHFFARDSDAKCVDGDGGST